jgi:hypothetical protein
VSTKTRFIPAHQRQAVATTGVLPAQAAATGHSLAPRFVRRQTARSLVCLGRAVSTDRQFVRQQWIDRGFPRFLGIAPVTDWTTGHGDLHRGNLTGRPPHHPRPGSLGRTPIGQDIGLLNAYTLCLPETAARVRTEFTYVLDTDADRTGELVAVAQLLPVASRGGHPELAPLLSEHAHKLTDVQPPKGAARPQHDDAPPPQKPPRWDGVGRFGLCGRRIARIARTLHGVYGVV